ncbi:energy-coupling factor transporter ATPase [Carnobacteriaceae bacterium zg-C25]|nr:energy-coupling factor transporter ATPase [Carnobacteriaceae bacterium zg-C25]
MAMSITFDQVSYIYQPNTPFEHKSLNDVSLTISEKDFVAVVGHTGSGKSTLIQHMNALLKPSQGAVSIDAFQITPETKDKQLKPLRQKVGIVFQFPEAQLFEETVLKDVMFGPLNFGDTPEMAKQKAIDALQLVGIDETLFERSPFELSGGQMRRVAIAGILAIQPDVLVLDEPTAGLDPKTRDYMMNLFHRLHRERELTIVLVTHQMNDVVTYANRVILLNQGNLMFDGPVDALFANEAFLKEHHIGLPHSLQFVKNLKEKGVHFSKNYYTTETLVDELVLRLGGDNVR